MPHHIAAECAYDKIINKLCITRGKLFGISTVMLILHPLFEYGGLEGNIFIISTIRTVIRIIR